jgi:hypothetical protein
MSEAGQIPDSIPRSFFVCNGGGPVKSQYLTRIRYRRDSSRQNITEWRLLREGSEPGSDPSTVENSEIPRLDVLTL